MTWHGIHSKKSINIVALAGFFIGAILALGGLQNVEAATGVCATATTDLGVDVVTVNIPAAATYTIWTRMKAPDLQHNSINMQVDASNCFSVGGGQFFSTSWPADSGGWINYSDGAPSSKISMSLTAGTHTLKYIGTQAGVEIDRIIVSSDASCTPTGTGDNCQSGDSTPPTVTLTAPTTGQGNVSGILNMTATAADAGGMGQVNFLVDGVIVGSDTSSPYSYSWNSAAIANDSHTFAAQAIDNAGNSTATKAITLAVNNTVSCIGNPMVPTNLSVGGATASSLTLSWSASTPATGCTLQGYRVYRNGVQVTTAATTSYTDPGLMPGTAYSYTIAAVDTSGHVSAQTRAVSGTAANDAVAPTTPTNVRTTLVGSNSVALAWTASTDNTAVTSYDVYRNTVKVGSVTTTAYTDNALTPNTTYSYAVIARDSAGNSSAASAALLAKTLAGTSANNGDLNGDGRISLTDLSIMLSHWNATGVPVTQGDVNADGKVTLTDLSILLSHWGQ